jgi:hypothetical protein
MTVTLAGGYVLTPCLMGFLGCDVRKAFAARAKGMSRFVGTIPAAHRKERLLGFFSFQLAGKCGVSLSKLSRFMPAFGDVWRGLVSPVLYTEETRTAMP